MKNLCQVIIWTRFGLYIIKLKATVTLNFDRLISKSIGIIYTPRTNVCAKFDEPRSILCLVNMRTRFGLYIKIMTFTVTLTFDIKINQDHLHSDTHICAKFDEPRSILCLVIYTTFGLLYQHVDNLCDLELRQIDLKIDRDHLHTNTNVCTKFKEPRSILCLVIIQTRFGLYINMLTVNVTLTFDQMTSKSIGIIYTPICMSVPNLTNLGQFCGELSSGQGKLYRPPFAT